MSSRGFNNNSNNANDKPTYSEKDLIKLLKLSKLVSTKDDNPPMSFQQPYSYMPQQPYMPQQQYMQQPMQQSQQYQELTKDERDEVRRLIYKSNEELEENLKNFIMSNQKKFLLYIKELLDYQSTVKTAENIQVKEEEEKKAEEAPQSANNVADTLKQMPSNIGSMFSNVTSTISGVVQSANSMFTGKKTTPTTPETSTTPTTPTTPETTTSPNTPTTPTNTKPSDLSIDNIPEGQPSSSNEDELDNKLDKILKENPTTSTTSTTPTTPTTTTQPTTTSTTSITPTTPKSEIEQLKESNKKAEEQLNKLKLEMKNLVPTIKQKGGHTLKNKKKNGSKKKKNSKRKIRKTNNLS
jgi:hypothetical protein